ncbi:DUF4468 domain-containing protein [Acinetobacter baumannii]
MKKILLAGFLGLGLAGCATTPQQPSEPVKFEKVYQIDGLNQAQIYDGARQWFAVAFASANAVIQYDDKASGTIIGKGNMRYPCSGMECLAMTGNERVDFTVRVDTKDGKMRVGYDGLTYSAPSHMSAGIMMPAQNYPITESRKSTPLIISKINTLSDDMAEKIKTQQKVNSNW